MGIAFEEPGDAYVSSLPDNLFPGALTPIIEGDLRKGAGKELDWKMRAPHSSSALAVNVFHHWRAAPLSFSALGHSGFGEMAFEVPCPTGLKGTSPHLDVLCTGAGQVLAIESKCTEFLVPKPARFSEAYNSITDRRCNSPWFRLISSLRAQPAQFRYLDVAQLIKHYLGLSHCYPNHTIKLLYLYWEPANPDIHEVFAQHRAELARFSQIVTDSTSNFNFEHLSYSELWNEWSPKTCQHLDYLRFRYVVSLA
jgi:hypothetical protein